MDSANAPSPPNTLSKTHSCVRCSDRKVKCDRTQPCNTCVRHNVECFFRELPPRRRRKKHTKEENLTERVKLYESLLKEKGIDPKAVTESSKAIGSHGRNDTGGLIVEDASQLRTPDSISFEPEGAISKPQLLYEKGRSKFLDNGLWTRVIEEFREPGDALGDSSDNSSEAEEGDEDGADLVLGLTPTLSSNKPPHPPINQVFELWQIFRENIDPLVKLVHVPTLQNAIQEATCNLEKIPRSLEALLFAIYSVAVMSLEDHDCEQKFGESRQTLLPRYIKATKVTLSRANLMRTANLVVLQAFILHLLSVRDVYDSRTLWTLTGVAARIGIGMGLHRDGTFLGLPPFETEIRRRVWSQIKTLDYRIADLSGSGSFGHIDTDAKGPKRAANINDDQIYLGMPSPPVESEKVTDMVYCAMRSEIGIYWMSYAARKRQQGKRGDLWDKHESFDEMQEIEKAIDGLEKILESKYVRFLDPSQPIQLMAMVVARSAVSKVRFIVHHPRRWASFEQIPDSEHRYVWGLCIKLLEQWSFARCSPQLKRFSWHLASSFQWQAFIHILDTTRATPLMPEAAKTWQLIEEIYESFPDLATNIKEPVHIAVGTLCLKAYSSRESALAKDGKPMLQTPPFITKLCRQRQAASASRDERRGRSKDPDISNMMLSTSSQITCPDQKILSDRNWRPTEPLPDLEHLPHDLPSQLRNLDHSQTPIESSAFWFVNSIDQGPSGSTVNNVQVDADFMLAQESNTDASAASATDWAQWDALLGDTNMITTLLSTELLE